MPLRISAFPKCYLDEMLVRHTISLFDWIEMARGLDADGLEMHDGFFASFESAYLDEVGERLESAGFALPMICCSPDFTHPDADFRKREIEREAKMIRVSRRMGGRGTVCRVLSGQRYPGLSRERGLEWVIDAIGELLPLAEECDVILGMENHYKDGLWQFDDPKRGERLTVEAAGLFRNYSKNRITDQTLKLLLQLAAESGLRDKIDAMFNGEKINITENRAVLHVALRASEGATILADGKNVVPEVHAVLDKMAEFSNRVRSGAWSR